MLNFSPNKSGSSWFVVGKIFNTLKNKKHQVFLININELKISKCNSCQTYCYKYGKCKINDDMHILYKHFQQDDVFICVTPVYFYHIPGYAKIMIDRCQPYWVRKYILKNLDLEEKFGSIVCIGATKGKKLFSGINLTMKYFFDIFNIKFNVDYNLYLRNVETPSDIKLYYIEKYLKQLVVKTNI
ncbi:MAG: flavodoxin family protein [Endomicrobia bacterium]|nr:flavodoxin family protein [Endomicrobiia bacterium]MCX7716207.1 flavodoxin family protein [Endomicrobiia bacterium]